MIGIVALAIGAAAGAGVVATTGATLPVGDRAAVERVVREYILANPEIIPEAMDKLRARDTAKAIAANRAAIETPFAGAWEGAADSDVTLVQFFDYNCGYCRAAVPDVQRLISEDPKLKVVYREFPVLGPESDAAARASLVAAKAGKYRPFHRALYAQRKPDEGAITRVAQALRLDLAATSDPAVQAEIDANLNLARPLGLTGTPAWVVGDKILIGAVGFDALKQAIAEARAK
ncbi:MAG: DsbA family protein [Sphingomonadaceae bacterium]